MFRSSCSDGGRRRGRRREPRRGCPNHPEASNARQPRTVSERDDPSQSMNWICRISEAPASLARDKSPATLLKPRSERPVEILRTPQIRASKLLYFSSNGDNSSFQPRVKTWKLAEISRSSKPEDRSS